MNGKVEHNGYEYAIRKLTPLECWRLMGWDDDSFHRAEAVCSNTQLYKQAGNGICTPVVAALAKKLFQNRTEPVYLIELFGGIGCQRKGFEMAGIPVIGHRYVDFDKYATMSYNAVWGENWEPKDITKIHAEDLGIDQEHDFCLFYSFPCTDLSQAGRMKGMKKGSQTRSGLLWEVERLLNESEVLPKYMIMENVTQVHGKKNLEDWNEWLEFLRSKGYATSYADLNAKDYGIAQNRNRTFAISILNAEDVNLNGDLEFNWPEKIPLTTCMADYLDDDVDEKYYIKSERAEELITELIERGDLDEYTRDS